MDKYCIDLHLSSHHHSSDKVHIVYCHQYQQEGEVRGCPPDSGLNNLVVERKEKEKKKKGGREKDEEKKNLKLHISA